jgi:hypothetical protein
LKNCDKMQRGMESFQPHEIANILHIMAKKQYTTCFLPELEETAGERMWGGCKHYARGCGRVSVGVRRALAFFDVQVSSWCDPDEASVCPSGNGIS